MFRKKKKEKRLNIWILFWGWAQASSVIPKRSNTGCGFGMLGGGWRQPLPFFARSVAGQQLSSLLSTLLHFPILWCPCADRHRREHVLTQKRCFCSCAFVPLILNVNISACSFVWKKKKQHKTTNYFLSWKSEEKQAFETFSWCVGKN